MFPSDWSFDGWRFILAADARLGTVCYADDGIWEWELGGGELPSLALRTSLGLRVRDLRLFPRFVQGRWAVSDPRRFYRPPQVEEIQAAYARVRCAPFPGLEVRLETWVPDSFRLVGRLTLHNSGLTSRTLRVEWAAVVRLLDVGRPFRPRRSGGRWWLEGEGQGQAWVVGLSAPAIQAVETPWAALGVEMTLAPGQQEVLTWALGRGTTAAEARQRAQAGLQAPWEAHITRLRAQQAAQEVHVVTGNPTWDAVLRQTQRTAWGFLFPASQHLPQASFVRTRQPDEGFSARGDGGDYSYRWAGQTVLEAWWLSRSLLPGGAAWVRGWVDNFLAIQAPDGFVDWRPGLGGQRGRFLAQPLLATLAWELGPYLDDPTAWWEEIFPHLLAFFQTWFTPAHDRDQDGFPEWDHAYQSGLEAAPIFYRPGAAGYGAGTPWVESPALAAWLYQEGRSLLRMAQHLQVEDPLPWLKARLAALRQEVEAAWDGVVATYRYRDTFTHRSPSGEVLLAFEREGVFGLERAFAIPQRITLLVEGGEGTTQPLTLVLRGEGLAGACEETISPRQWSWRGGYGMAIVPSAFTRLDFVEVQGLANGMRGRVIGADYTFEDVSLLLPMWAGIPSPARVAQLVEQTVKSRYLRRYGLSLCPSGGHASEAEQFVWPLWNTFVGEGLLRYGYCDLAADLVGRLLDGIGRSLATSGDFYSAYDAERGQGQGEQHAVDGLAPLSLFLRTLGLVAITPERVILQNGNPFNRPITVQYQGITVQFHSNQTWVTFPGHSIIKVEGPGTYQVVRSRSSQVRRLL
ncbi:hypothetical protein SE15_00500 [Thermanaerothrix daxensis]|uniref:Glycosyl hydrolase family 63 C-terminal domain-containing protein n=1 Tax=Thermanaerothrix daxensis TaxID=869279 RepID=A0A0P6YFM4_9CHLR|nr:hypothetical protein [Thermanaerothrix daxensis]KPL83777.1 hypothetical protein SE15_00500 [Thermanaerothrix daxensis]